MNRSSAVTVRQARPEDVDAIVDLEKTVYGPLGTACYGEEYVRAWLEVHPEGLIVAERDGRLVAYLYFQIVDFGFDKLDRFATYDETTDDGFTRRSHRPDGNCVLCVTACSIESGANRAVTEHVYDLGWKLGMKYTLSQSRMPGFDAYLRDLESRRIDIPAGVSPDALALWYVLQTVIMVNGAIWPCLADRPDLPLPAPPGPDPVLSKHFKYPGAGLAALLPRYMRDPQSRDYAALLVSEYPPRP